MVDHEVAVLVAHFPVVAGRDRARGLDVRFAGVVRAQHVDVVGRDVVEGEERGFCAEGRDPLAVVARQAGLHGSLAEGGAVVGGCRNVHGGEVEARDIQVVVAGHVCRAGEGDVDVAARGADAGRDGVGLAAVLETASRGSSSTECAETAPQFAPAAEAVLGAEEHVVGARDVDRGLAGDVRAATACADRARAELAGREVADGFRRRGARHADPEQRRRAERDEGESKDQRARRGEAGETPKA